MTIVLIHFIMKFAAAGLCRLSFTLYTGITRVSLGEESLAREVTLNFTLYTVQAGALC